MHVSSLGQSNDGICEGGEIRIHTTYKIFSMAFLDLVEWKPILYDSSLVSSRERLHDGVDFLSTCNRIVDKMFTWIALYYIYCLVLTTVSVKVFVLEGGVSCYSLCRCQSLLTAPCWWIPSPHRIWESRLVRPCGPFDCPSARQSTLSRLIKRLSYQPMWTLYNGHMRSNHYVQYACALCKRKEQFLTSNLVPSHLINLLYKITTRRKFWNPFL